MFSLQDLITYFADQVGLVFERGQLVDLMADMQQYFYRKKVALVGDPDQVIALETVGQDRGPSPWGRPAHGSCASPFLKRDGPDVPGGLTPAPQAASAALRSSSSSMPSNSGTL